MDPHIELCTRLFLPAYLKHTYDEFDFDGNPIGRRYTHSPSPHESQDLLHAALMGQFEEYISRLHDIEIVQADLYRAEVKDQLKEIRQKSHLQTYELKLRSLNISPPAPYSDTYEGMTRYITFLQEKCPFIKLRNYVYEQRSEGDEHEYGWHIHATVSSSYPVSKIDQYLTQKKKSHKMEFNVKVKEVKSLANWDSYIGNGCAVDKHNESKVAAVKKDSILREKYNIPKIFYTSNVES